MSGEVQEPVPVENVPANSAVILVKPTQCLRVKWDGEIGKWVEFGMGPYTMGSATFMLTHVLPDLEYLEDGGLNVVGWQVQTYKLREGFAPTVFVIPMPMMTATYVLLESGAELEVAGIAYLQQAERVEQLSDRVAVSRNDGEGGLETIYLQLPYDLKEK